MSTQTSDLVVLYKEIEKELKAETSESDAIGNAAALLILANEVSGVKNELSRIANLLGADTVQEGKISQSDVADTLLALLTSLKATANSTIK